MKRNLRDYASGPSEYLMRCCQSHLNVRRGWDHGHPVYYVSSQDWEPLFIQIGFPGISAGKMGEIL